MQGRLPGVTVSGSPEDRVGVTQMRGMLVKLKVLHASAKSRQGGMDVKVCCLRDRNR